MIKAKIYDIECFKRIFFAAFYDINTGEWAEFEISKWKNDLYKMIKYFELLKEQDYYCIGFNNVNYDAQILQYIIENYDKWADKAGEEIALIIQKFSSKTIENSNYGLRPIYNEFSFYNKQIDLFKIHHFDNESRRCSLKWLQYMMNWWNVEESPIPFLKDNLTREEADEVISYCKNDILSTHLFYQYTVGEVKHKQYSGKNKIQDRLTIIEEGLLGPEAINYSDSKLGDELNKKSYCRLTGKSINDIYELKKNRGATKKFTFGDAIPKYVEFKTPELNNFLNKIKKVRVSLIDGDRQEFPLTFKGTGYTIAKGGIHSTEAHRIIQPTDNEILRDADVGLKCGPIKILQIDGNILRALYTP